MQSTANHHKKTHKSTITANPQTHHHSTSELESHRAALNHELIDLINCLIRPGSRVASIAEAWHNQVRERSAKPIVKPSDQIRLRPSRSPVTRSAKPQCEKVEIGGGFVRERRWGVGLCDRDERGGRGFVLMTFGKWFTENFSVNRFPFFP